VPQRVENMVLRSKDGREFHAMVVINLLVATSRNEALHGERQLIESTKWAKLLDGSILSEIDEETYRIVCTGEILKRKPQ
jgi:hypothetical protein